MSSLLVFSVVPAAMIGWFLYRSNLHSVQTLSEKILEDVVQRAQTDTQAHLLQAHEVLNGLIQERPGDAAAVRARLLIQQPELFEQTAFGMTGMMPDVPKMYVGTYQGQFLGVETLLQDSGSLLWVSERKPGDQSGRLFSASYAGDRRVPLPLEAGNYEPRSQAWYQAAMQHKARVFTPVQVADKQLVLTLVQPVYGADDAALGVFAIDLTLRRLGQMLQGMRISPRGAVFLVDEQGLLVASSSGDELFSETGGMLQRHSPGQSANPIIRSAYAEAASSLGKTTEPSVQRESFLRRIAMADDSLMVALKPFGEDLGVRWSLVAAAPESDFTQASQAALEKALAITGLTLVLGALLASGLALRLSRRFKLLSAAAAQLAQAEVAPVQHATHLTEVRELSQILHDSAAQLRRNHAAIEAHAQALQQANETLEVRVTERTAELNASREEALASVRAKAAFLAAMSHEIRTPLNGVVGMTTLLADTALDHEQRDYVHTMRVSSDQLLGVINDILDFSKIELGKLELENEPLNLLTTIEEACDIGAPRAREKGLELLVDIGDELSGWVRGDVTRLRQVLLNLLNNAVKFTEQGQVIVSAHVREDFSAQQGALVEFRVQDSGIGISADRQAALFESFVQVDASTTRKYGGSGLGLAICKRLATLMGGSVGLQSVPGQGSTFWFTARLGHTDAPEASRLSSLHLVSLAGKRAAVVDDTPVNLRILDKQLRRWGMAPVLFEDAAQALAWLQSHSVDVVVTDMHMPAMDGQKFAQKLRERRPALPIVLLTSGTMPMGESARLFDARLLKPYRQSRFFEALALVTSQPVAPAPDGKVEPTAPTNQFILVADDNAINLKVALAMLAKLGYEAATAVNGREAVERVAASLRTGTGETPRHYAAILMDVNMPVMDGCAASRQIIASHGAAAPPIIALTASVLEEDRQRCFHAGMVGFLPKPLRIDELSEVLACHARYPEPANANANANANAVAVAVAVPLVEAPLFPVRPGAAGPGLQPVQVLVDWSRLEQFREFDDDELSMTREVIALFTSESPQRMSDIRLALSACDSAALSRAAHALKGAASNVGAQALSQTCGFLEQSCLQGQWPADAAAQVNQIIHFADKTRQALTDWAKPDLAAQASEQAV
ncbi:MAG: response regulator [Pseudomonadota bacterium]|nr:response regulator [Pseudomonadota bacterium]